MKLKITPFEVTKNGEKIKIVGIFLIINDFKDISKQRIDKSEKTIELTDTVKEQINERVQTYIYNGQIKTVLGNTVFWQIEPSISIPYSSDLLKQHFEIETPYFQYTEKIKDFILAKCELIKREIEKIGMNEKYITLTNTWNKGKLYIEVKDLETQNKIIAVIHGTPNAMHSKIEKYIIN